jgi:hypothetical protein
MRLPDLIGRHKRWKAVFGSEMGRMVLRELLLECRLDGNSFVPGDPYGTAFNAGAEEVGRRVLRILREDPAEMMDKLEQERNNE